MSSNKDNRINMDESLCKVFVDETREQLEQWVQILLVLEKNPEQLSEKIHELFRVAHNIKGSSGMMGLVELKETMHKAENLFDAVRNGKAQLTVEHIDFLLEFPDAVLAYIEAGDWNCPWEGTVWNQKFDIESNGKFTSQVFPEIPLVLNTDEKKAVAEWQIGGHAIYGIDVRYKPDAMMRSASSLSFLKFLEKWGTVFKTAPAVSELAAEQYISLKVVLQVPEFLDKTAESAIQTFPIYDLESITLRRWDYHPNDPQATPATNIQTKADLDNTIRVEAAKINKLINNVGELLTLKTGLSKLTRERNQGPDFWNQLSKLTQQLEHITDEFQNEILDLRMVPVNQLFSRFPKIIRDIAKKKNVSVELDIVGGETEIDKQISERLIDPLTHLIRNAVDHGIDAPDRRKALRKPETGKIVLSAVHQGDTIVIGVSDDGAGLDLQKIRKKAIEKNLITEKDSLSEDETIRLIFYPGFSTSDKITDISGRGVGLDVVKTSINELKGDIEVTSQLNQGTTFHLRLPLTLAIVQSFMVSVAGQTYGIPASDVLESTAISKENIRDIGGNQAFLLRGEVIPIIELGSLFMGLNYQQALTVNIPILLIKKKGQKFGLMVDELIGEEEIMIKQINKALPENPLIAGATLMGNGEIGLILDVNEIIIQAGK